MSLFNDDENAEPKPLSEEEKKAGLITEIKLTYQQGSIYEYKVSTEKIGCVYIAYDANLYPIASDAITNMKVGVDNLFDSFEVLNPPCKQLQVDNGTESAFGKELAEKDLYPEDSQEVCVMSFIHGVDTSPLYADCFVGVTYKNGLSQDTLMPSGLDEFVKPYELIGKNLTDLRKVVDAAGNKVYEEKLKNMSPGLKSVLGALGIDVDIDILPKIVSYDVNNKEEVLKKLEDEQKQAKLTYSRMKTAEDTGFNNTDGDADLDSKDFGD